MPFGKLDLVFDNSATAEDAVRADLLILGGDSPVMTARGARPAADLGERDQVLTRDHGFCAPVLVARLRRATASQRIGQGTLTPDLPTQALSLAHGARLWAPLAPHHAPLQAGALEELGAVEELAPSASVLLLFAQPVAVMAAGVWLDCPHPAGQGQVRTLAAQITATDRPRLFQHFPVPPRFDERQPRRQTVKPLPN